MGFLTGSLRGERLRKGLEGVTENWVKLVGLGHRSEDAIFV